MVIHIRTDRAAIAYDCYTAIDPLSGSHVQRAAIVRAGWQWLSNYLSLAPDPRLMVDVDVVPGSDLEPCYTAVDLWIRFPVYSHVQRAAIVRAG